MERYDGKFFQSRNAMRANVVTRVLMRCQSKNMKGQENHIESNQIGAAREKEGNVV